MLDGLRDLFLRAFKCKTEGEANGLIDEWNKEITSIQRRFDHYYTDKINDGKPVVHAHWIYPYKNTCHDADITQCSNCGSYFQDKINNVSFYYKCCPHCYAKMDEGGKGKQ